MGVIPGWMMPHRIIVEAYQGEAGTGPVYAAPVEVKCFRDDKRKLVRNQLGEEVVSETQCFCEPGTVAPPKSRVQLLGFSPRTTFVLAEGTRDGGDMPTPDHVEVALQ